MEITFNRAREMAQRLLSTVDDEVRSRRAGIEAELKRVHAEAWASGLAEGLSRVTEHCAQSATSRLEVLEELTPRLITLVGEIARQVVGHELSVNPDSIALRVTKALKLLKQDVRYELRIHPSQMGHLASDNCVVSDEALNPGEFVVRGSFGQIYSRPQRHLEHLISQISF